MATHEAMVYLCLHEREAEGRWFIAKDMNCDGVFTISDMGLWLEWAFFLPGDGMLWTLMQLPKIATFLELTPIAYGGWISGIASAVVWINTLGTLAMIGVEALCRWFR